MTNDGRSNCPMAVHVTVNIHFLFRDQYVNTKISRFFKISDQNGA